MLMGAKTEISSRHSIIVVSFLVSYLAILSAPKTGLDSVTVAAPVDFGAMQTFEEWDKGGVIHVLVITINTSI